MAFSNHGIEYTIFLKTRYFVYNLFFIVFYRKWGKEGDEKKKKRKKGWRERERRNRFDNI